MHPSSSTTNSPTKTMMSPCGAQLPPVPPCHHPPTPPYRTTWPLSPSTVHLAPALPCSWFALAWQLMDAELSTGSVLCLHRLFSGGTQCLDIVSGASHHSSASPTRLLRSLSCYAALSVADLCVLTGSTWKMIHTEKFLWEEAVFI